MSFHKVNALVLSVAGMLLLAGCVSFVAPYDSQFDSSLNQLSSDTAKFIAAAEAGGKERSITSAETTSYYAGAYNVLDRLSQRAALHRGKACPNNASLKSFAEESTSSSELPGDYIAFDCLEAQLYYVRFYLDQMRSAHVRDATLNIDEAKATGGILLTQIAGAIQTFLVAK